MTRREFVTTAAALGAAPLRRTKSGMALGSEENQKVLQGSSVPAEQAELVQVHEDFSRDPGWESVHNRIVCKDCPTVTQAFGWGPTSHLGGRLGEVGGRIWQSTTPALYGMPLGRPLSYNDRFSASGRIAFKGTEEGRGAAYVGFFNNSLQGWRAWSSVGLRFYAWPGEKVGVCLDCVDARWGADHEETDIFLTADGSVHTWRMEYDPEARMPDEWPDPRLKNYLTRKRQTLEQIYEKARRAEPGLRREVLRRRLRTAEAEGFLSYFPRTPGFGIQSDRPGHFWTLSGWDPARLRGAVSFQFDSGPVYKLYIRTAHREVPQILNRFGLFNFQMYHRWLEFYVADLKVNGKEIDLSEDPEWEGQGNRVQFVERDFQRQDYGYSETNWAGEQIGEIGGQFYRAEPDSPSSGYYADDIGILTLDDPISFSGNICFVAASTDSGMFFGYFSAREQMARMTEHQRGYPLNDMMGIFVDGPNGSRIGAMCSPKINVASERNGPTFLPTRDRHAFRFDYDPRANRGVGRITFRLDERQFMLDLKPEQRAAGARFDHFGIMNKRHGGKFVRVYFDDFNYTARRPSGYKRVFHPQRIWRVSYPKGGRAD